MKWYNTKEYLPHYEGKYLLLTESYAMLIGHWHGGEWFDLYKVHKEYWTTPDLFIIKSELITHFAIIPPIKRTKTEKAKDYCDDIEKKLEEFMRF